MQYIYIYIYIVPLYFEWKWFRPLANSPPTSSPRSNRVRLLCDEFAPYISCIISPPYLIEFAPNIFIVINPIHSYKPYLPLVGLKFTRD